MTWPETQCPEGYTVISNASICQNYVDSVGGTYNGEVVNAGNWVDGCIQNKPLGDVYYFNRKDSNKDTGIFGGHRVCIGLLYLRKYATNVGIFFVLMHN